MDCYHVRWGGGPNSPSMIHPDRLAVHGSRTDRETVALVAGTDEGVLRGALWGDVAVEHPDVSAAGCLCGKTSAGCGRSSRP